jgi:hypothetical protein
MNCCTHACREGRDCPSRESKALKGTTVISDLVKAIRAGVREYRRLRWVRTLVRREQLPF